MSTIPRDPVMLLSYVNTQLRDYYPTLDDCCISLGIDREELITRLHTIEYTYDEKRNQFV